MRWLNRVFQSKSCQGLRLASPGRVAANSRDMSMLPSVIARLQHRPCKPRISVTKVTSEAYVAATKAAGMRQKCAPYSHE